MKIGKMLVGGLLASSSIGNTSSTFVKMGYGSHGLVKTFELRESVNHYNKVFDKFTKVQPKSLVELKTVDRLMDDHGGIRPITCAGCEDGCWQAYLQACTACQVAFVNPAAYGLCMGAAFGVYLGCMKLCRG